MASSLKEWAAEHCTMPYRAPELFEPRNYAAVTTASDVCVIKHWRLTAGSSMAWLHLPADAACVVCLHDGWLVVVPVCGLSSLWRRSC